MMDWTSDALTRAAVDRAMRVPAPEPPPYPPSLDPEARLTRAAVLCPIVERSGALSVLFTRRAEHLKAHAGQISFPGGKIDPGDNTPLHAALREAEEEIGLAPRQVDIAGSLDPYPTGTGYLVTPFVGFVDPRFRAVPAPAEVAEIFEIPMDFLMDRRNYRRESAIRNGGKRYYYVITHDRHRVWGATAAILRALSERLSNDAGTRPGTEPRA